MKTAALALLLLAACGPQWEDRDGWAMEGAAPAHVAEVLHAADELRSCDFRWGGWIAWMPGPFDCSGVRAEGCFRGADDMSARIDAAGEPFRNDARWSALPHELGHYLAARCQGDYSEDAARLLQGRIVARASELLAH